MMYNRKVNKAIFLIVTVTIVISLSTSPCLSALDWINSTSNSKTFFTTSSYTPVGFKIPTNTNLWTQSFSTPAVTINNTDTSSSENSQIVTTSTAEFKTTAADQVAIVLTVYSNNLGLVKDIRDIQPIPVGQGELLFIDVPLNINPSSVMVKSQNYPAYFTVLEQTFENNLMTTGKLLDEYVGKTVKLVDWNMYHNTQNIVEATLLSTPQIYDPYSSYSPYSPYSPYPPYEQYGQIYKINGEIYLGHPGYTVIPEMPEDYVEKPSLVWSYENGIQDAHRLEVSYLAHNINWSADYTLILNNEENLADLSSWITVNNQSGATYKNAHLILVAGNVQRVAAESYPVAYGSAFAGYTMTASYDIGYAQFEEEAFFEYHTYDLDRTTTIKDKESKQISMLEATGIAIEKEFLVEGGIVNYLKRYYYNEQPTIPVNVYIKFENSEDSNLGIPLPAGVMRLFKEDDENNLYFIGEDTIAHTPKDEEVRLRVGEAFDIVAEIIQKDYRQIQMNVYESDWEITIKNHKNNDVTVRVQENLTDDWEIIDSTFTYEKIDAYTIQFDIPVPRDEEVVLEYSVRVTEPQKEPEYIPVYYPASAPYYY